MEKIQDARALAYPDEPYSAYCRICWQPVYSLWADKQDHHRGRCAFPDAETQDEPCAYALGLEGERAKLRAFLKAQGFGDAAPSKAK